MAENQHSIGFHSVQQILKIDDNLQRLSFDMPSLVYSLWFPDRSQIDSIW
jgi:hypothetical protein